MTKKTIRFVQGDIKPKWWTTFCSRNHNDFWYYNNISYYDRLDVILKKYNAKIQFRSNYIELTFKSDEDYMLFLLKYS